MNSVPGIEHIQSTSSPGASVVVITFSLEKRIDVAFQEVQAKVNQVVRRLPKDADPPVVAKVETNTQAILQTALQGDRTQQQLNLYAINVIKKQLRDHRRRGRGAHRRRAATAPSASTCCRRRWPASAWPRRTSPTPSAASTSSSPAASWSGARPSTW